MSNVDEDDERAIVKKQYLSVPKYHNISPARSEKNSVDSSKGGHCHEDGDHESKGAVQALGESLKE